MQSMVNINHGYYAKAFPGRWPGLRNHGPLGRFQSFTSDQYSLGRGYDISGIKLDLGNLRNIS
jgi:hypothetical protein